MSSTVVYGHVWFCSVRFGKELCWVLLGLVLWGLVWCCWVGCSRVGWGLVVCGFVR